MYTCYCYECNSRDCATLKTLRTHLKRDEELLSRSDIPDHLRARLQICIENNKELLINANPRSTFRQQHEDDLEDTIEQADHLEELTRDVDQPSSKLDLFEIITADSNIDDQDEEPEEEIIQAYNGNIDDGGTPDNLSSEEDDADTNMDTEDETTTPINLALPAELLNLRKELLGDYKLPTTPPETYIKPRALEEFERLSLQHYIAWRNSNGTVLAYNEHRKVLQNSTNIEIISLYRVRKLAASLTRFYPTKVDMCPKSCIAYTGSYKDLDTCPHIIPSSGVPCGVPRFKSKSGGKEKPNAQVTILPVMETIKAMFSNPETSHKIRHRDSCLRAALDVVGNATKRFSDFGNGAVHQYQYEKLHLFQDHRGIAFALSTDGAQLTMKKQSHTWLLILIVLNLPPEIRYTSGDVIINLATPGPNSPGDIESFLRPLFEEMAHASEGLWIWDAVDSSYFTHRAYIMMALGDMLGSAKLNGMAGHSAIFGDRFSLVQGAKASISRGARALYYPMNPPENNRYNPSWPASNDLSNLPIRTEEHYWQTINRLSAASSKQQRAKITKETGISRLPLCAASPTFIHPTFFPVDPFHLFYENCMAFIWDTWTSTSKPTERIHLPENRARRFGEAVAAASKTLPPAFCGPVRDPFLKRHSQYKIYEWMALLHWYTLPIGMELGFDACVLENFSHFVSAIEFAMSIQTHSETEIAHLHSVMRKFLAGFEALYVAGNPENISRFRLCIFQLIHIPMHIKWNGSICVGSQATVERTIGEVGHKIRSKKSPFANLANIITEKELLRILKLYYPSLTVESVPFGSNVEDSEQEETDLPQGPPQTKLIQKIMLTKKDSEDAFVINELESIERHFQIDLSDPDSGAVAERWGKARLANGRLLRSRISDIGSSATRFYRWFEASINENDKTRKVFGGSVAFYHLEINDIVKKVVLYHQLVDVKQTLGQIWGQWDWKTIHVTEISAIVDIVGIWEAGNESKNVYVLRKHPAIALLNPEELGKDSEVNRNEDLG